MGTAWFCLVTAEMISGQFGIGYYTWASYTIQNYADIVVGMLFIGVIGHGQQRAGAPRSATVPALVPHAKEEATSSPRMKADLLAAGRPHRHRRFAAHRPKGAQAFERCRTSRCIAPGEFVCVLGPSGCGKSTLLGALAGH
jgi:ABC-type multidrug transport system fused ATPase/permease subunit